MLQTSDGRLILLTAIDIGGEVELDQLIDADGVESIMGWARPVEIELGTARAKIHRETLDSVLYADVFSIGVVILRLEIALGTETVTEITQALQTMYIEVDGIPLEKYVESKLQDVCQRLRGKGGLNWRDYAILDLGDQRIPITELREHHSHDVTQFLSGELAVRDLQEKEIADKWTHDVSYYADDLCLVSYEAAFVMGCKGYFRDLLRYIELAIALSVLFQLRDRLVDKEIEQAFRTVRAKRMGIFALQNLGRSLLRVSMVQLEVLDTIEDLMNPLKVTHDWYYQSTYSQLQDILKVKEYRWIVEQKISALQNLYGAAQETNYTRLAIVLEAAIVVLILFEIVSVFI